MHHVATDHQLGTVRRSRRSPRRFLRPRNNRRNSFCRPTRCPCDLLGSLSVPGNLSFRGAKLGPSSRPRNLSLRSEATNRSPSPRNLSLRRDATNRSSSPGKLSFRGAKRGGICFRWGPQDCNSVARTSRTFVRNSCNTLPKPALLTTFRLTSIPITAKIASLLAAPAEVVLVAKRYRLRFLAVIKSCNASSCGCNMRSNRDV
jgi:hypothetical protein